MAAYGEGVYGAGVYGSGNTVVALGHATETTTVHPLAIPVPVPLGHATEATTVHALATAVPVPLGVASEVTTVHPLSGVGAVVELGHATETTSVHALEVDPGYTAGVSDNAVQGRGNRAQPATWMWEPNVEPVPAGLSLAVRYDTALAFDTPVVTNGRPVVAVSSATRLRDRHRILVGGVDVTYFRGVPTPELDYQLVEPLMYGPASFLLPQVTPWCETPGEGDLSWLKPEARVVQQRVDADGNVTATDYKGVIIAFDTSGPDLRVEVGGQVSGRAALMQKQIPLVRNVQDIGRRAYFAVRACNADFRPHLGPTTGIEVEAFGGTSHLDYINQLCALGWTKAGAQWSIMPDAEGTYRMARKDATTVHATIYAHDEQLPASLRRDLAEEPNRIYGTGVTKDGMRVLGGVYPGLRQGDAPDYPMAGGAPFGEGTTDADTTSGEGITVMKHHLRTHGYLSLEDAAGDYDADVTEAVEDLQADAELPVTGVMDPDTWAALYDTSATGFSMRLSRIEPLAQRSYTKKWRRTASGAILGRNPKYQPGRLKVDRNVDFGVTFSGRRQMTRWAKAERDEASDNWVGTITLETGAVVVGDHTPGTPITEADVMPALDVKPGMNVSLPLFMGGIVAHVSGVSVSGGKVTLSVDTRARDTLPVWEVIRRNRESRRNPHRAWIRDHLSSGMVKDAITEFSEVGGILGDDVTLRAGEWRVFEVVAGRSGTVGRLRLRTSPDAEFCVAVFGQRISEAKLEARIGNPLSSAGRANWQDADVLDEFDQEHILLYTAGDPDAPCGYYPGSKLGDDGQPSGDPLTGRWDDDASFEYRTGPSNVLRVAVYADRDTVIEAGRIMWPLLEPGS